MLGCRGKSSSQLSSKKPYFICDDVGKVSMKYKSSAVSMKTERNLESRPNMFLGMRRNGLLFVGMRRLHPLPVPTLPGLHVCRSLPQTASMEPRSLSEVVNKNWG